MRLGAVVLDCADAEALADFYSRLLKWEKSVQFYDEDKWVIVSDPQKNGTPLVFQEIEDYRAPVWPSEPGRQQQMMHLDFYVGAGDEMVESLKHALACGAKPAPVQFSGDWQVFLDPAGHPFCIIPIPLGLDKS